MIAISTVWYEPWIYKIRLNFIDLVQDCVTAYIVAVSTVSCQFGVYSASWVLIQLRSKPSCW